MSHLLMIRVRNMIRVFHARINRDAHGVQVVKNV